MCQPNRNVANYRYITGPVTRNSKQRMASRTVRKRFILKVRVEGILRKMKTWTK
jgi:hypothetical protein